MKKLTKVILVHWYRLQAVEIPIVGNTAFIGDNGAGKSALLDAIQTVLTGGNKSLLVLNRGSNEQSSRKIWEYVLGVMSDPKRPDLATKIKPREKANCYLALNFFDEDTKETTCVGMGIYASLADMAEKIEGHFICPGLVGTKGLFLEQQEGDNNAVVLPWQRVKERLSQRCPAVMFFPSDSPGKFTADFYALMSEHPGSPNNHKTVLKALQAAFRLEKISDTTEFIRRYMLDRDDLQIKELQSALKNYRDMAEKAESVSRRVADLTQLEGCCDKVENGRHQKVTAEYVSLCARTEEVDAKADPVRSALADLEEERERLTQRSTEQNLHLEQLNRELGERQAELKNSDLQTKRERLQLEIDQNQTIVDDSKAKLTELRLLMQRLAKLKDVPATDTLAAAITNLTDLLPGDDMISSAAWPADPARLDAALGRLHEALEKALPMLLHSRYDRQCGELSALEKRIENLVGMLRQLQHGKAPLQSNTRNLIQFYKEHGIEAKPLCDLVDVTDETWRDTIESVLGNIREALVVIPEQARKAVNLYRYEGRQEFPGCHIVNTTQTDRWKDKRQKGSLAEHLKVDDIHAQAFINRRLGNIICVETEKELLQHDRAATADGMLSSGGTVSELKAIPPILGRGSRESLQAAYQKELNAAGEDKEELTRKKNGLGSLKNLLEGFQQNYGDGAVSSVVTLVAKRDDALATIADRQAKRTSLEADSRDTALKAEIKRLEGAVTETKNVLKKLTDDLAQAEKKYTQNEDKLKALDEERKIFGNLLEEMRTNPLLDRPSATETLDRWRDQCGYDFAALIARADAAISSAQHTIDHNEKKIFIDYAEYHQRYSVEEGDDTRPESFEEYAATIRRKKNHLVETTLALYREKSARALREAEDTFRAKFVGRLVGKLEGVRTQISQLNKTLERHPFHNEIYKFRQYPNPEFKHIIDFAKALGNQPAGVAGGLFDPAHDPDSPHHKALADINAALQDPKAAEQLQDYRNFLVFEVEMCDTEGTPTADLEHRIQKGSGGENQTPYYVATGASLAAAYRIKETFGQYEGGMSLAVFDEAFSKLSVATCHSCIEFLKNIQLQLVVAAPDEKYATMAEVMDEIVWVTREGGTVDIEVIYIKPEMRAMLRSDNPYRQASGTAGFLHEPG